MATIGAGILPIQRIPAPPKPFGLAAGLVSPGDDYRQWQRALTIADLAGKLRGKGSTKSAALDAAWKSFQRCER
jgi:hypothetical protein